MAKKSFYKEIYLTLSLNFVFGDRIPYLNNTQQSPKGKIFWLVGDVTNFPLCLLCLQGTALCCALQQTPYSSLTSYKALIHTSKPGSTYNFPENIPVNSRRDFVLALMIALIPELVTSLSLPKDRNQAWFFSRSTSVWHGSWTVVHSHCVIGYESTSEHEIEQVHIHDRAVVPPGPATEPCQESCHHDWGKPPPPRPGNMISR